MHKIDTLVYLGSFAVAAAGLLVGFWPLCVLGIAIAVLYGHEFFGIGMALIFDLIFGAPTGVLHYVHFPLVVFSLICFIIRSVALRYVLERDSVDTL